MLQAQTTLKAALLQRYSTDELSPYRQTTGSFLMDNSIDSFDASDVAPTPREDFNRNVLFKERKVIPEPYALPRFGTFGTYDTEELAKLVLMNQKGQFILNNRNKKALNSQINTMLSESQPHHQLGAVGVSRVHMANVRNYQ